MPATRLSYIDDPTERAPEPPQEFPSLLAALYTQKYTGAVTLHLIHGVPTVVELPSKPTRIPLRVPPRT